MGMDEWREEGVIDEWMGWREGGEVEERAGFGVREGG